MVTKLYVFVKRRLRGLEVSGISFEMVNILFAALVHGEWSAGIFNLLVANIVDCAM